MKLAIMQPYLFPYIGYFQLINYVDKWIVFDDTQYISKGWVNRNRILHPDIQKEWQYFTIPLKKHSRDSRIKDISINEQIDWRQELLGKLSSYKRKAPHYSETMEFVYECIEYKNESLSEWLIHSLKTTCEYLQIVFDYSVFSPDDINTEKVRHAGQWALEIADAVGAKEYINPHGGYSIFIEDEFIERGIELRFLKPGLTPYVQRRGCFTSGLSIIDIMMWNDRGTIHEMLSDFDVCNKSELIDGQYE